MKTIIAGSRELTDYAEVVDAASEFSETITEVVSGGCRGTDLLGEEWALARGIPIKRFPYESEHGTAGGPIRNRKMAAYAEALVALWDGKSAGTGNMIEEARKRGLVVYIHHLKKRHD